MSSRSLLLIIIFLLIPIVLLLRLQQRPKTVEAEWYNDAWTYRQAINISSHTAAESNVFVTAVITIGSTAKAQADDGDFRFTTQSGQLLSYYRSSGVGTTSITFHIQLESFPAGAQTLYAYYGNPSADNGFSLSDFSTEASSYSIGSYSSEETGGGPVAYWKFDEGVGTSAYDSSASRLNAALTASPSWIPEDQCISGKCLYSSSASYLTVPDNPAIDFDTNSFTVSFWIRPQDYTYPKTSFALKKGNAPYTAGNAGWSIADTYVSTGAQIVINDGTNLVNSNLTFNSGSRPTDFLNKWTHLAYVFNRTTGLASAHVNGIQQNSTVNISSVTGSINNASTLLVGYGTGWTYKGYFDDVKIYPYARTATQIKQDYLASAPKGSSVNIGNQSASISNGLIAHWKMDEGVGTTTLDSSGNSNTATFGTGDSAPAWTSGKYGVGTSFDMVNDYIGTTISSINTTAGGYNTVSFWMYWNGTAGKIPINLYGGSSTHYELWFPGATCMGFNTGASDAYGINPTGLSNQWIHVVLVFYNGAYTNKNQIYINGVNQTLTQCLGSAQSGGAGTSLYLGSMLPNQSYFFGGKIDEVRIYNRALTLSEVEDLYQFAPGPVAHWKFDEGVGTTAYDTSGNSNNGALGAGTSAPTWTTGKIGKALSFDGGNDYVNMGDNNIWDFGIGNFTLMAWIKRNSFTTRDAIIGKDNSSGGTRQFHLLIIDTDTIRISYFSATDSQVYLDSTGTITDSNWHFIVGQRNGNSFEIYIDGKLSGSGTTSGSHGTMQSTNANLWIGRREYGGYTDEFDGQIDDVRIYNYARSPKQILEDMSAGRQNQMLVHYKFDEGSGTTVNNSGIGSTLTGTFGAGNSAPSWTNTGKFAKALSFDGSNDYLSIGGTVTNTQTISFWVNPNGITNNNFLSLSSSVSIGATNNILFANGFASPSFYVNGIGTSLLTTGVWQHVVISTGTTITANAINIGKNSTNYFNGLLDDVKIYNYALTADEVKTDYNQGASLVAGSSNQTIGSTTTSLDYCLPGDTSACSPPIAEWSFDEGSGLSAYDRSGNGNTGTFGTGNSAPTWTTGKIGKGLKFDGSNDLVDAGNSTSLTNIAIKTITFWTKLVGQTGVDSTGSHFINKDNKWFIATDPPNSRNIFGQNFSGTSGRWSFPLMSLNTWHFVSVVYDRGSTANNPTIYVDNQAQTVTEYSTPIGTASDDSATNLYLSYATTYGRWLNGSIDQVRIYNYARTPAQIAWDYNRGGPIGWWKLDECEGSVAHDSAAPLGGVGNTGAISIGASGTQNTLGTCTVGTSAAWTAGATGKWNSSLNFDGTDDYVSITDNSSLDSTHIMTLSAWIYTSGTLPSNEGIVMKRVNSSEYCQYEISRSSNNLYWLQSSSGSGWETLVSSSSLLTAGSWHHLVGTNNGTIARFYIDGVDVGTTDSSPATTLVGSTSPLIIGQARVASTDNYFTGQLDDVRIYNYALTATQVKQLYNGGAMNFR